jgi:peptide chain release factor subunit 1
MMPLSSWREELKQLAEIESSSGTAVTFYFQPRIPQNKAHREEMILIKDLVRDARRELERKGNLNAASASLDRIQRIAEELQRNGSRSKAVFACNEPDIWQEFDLPADVGETALHVNTRFRLTPLASAVLAVPPATVVLVDRERARILELNMEELKAIEEIVDDVPRRVKTEGFGGYNAGRLERSIGNEEMRHYKHVAERLLERYNRGDLHLLLIGCRPETLADFEPHLHDYVRQRMVGRLDVDPTHPEGGNVREEATRKLEQYRKSEEQALIREVLGESQRNGRGSIGLRHVLTSLERGEIQTLLIGKNFAAQAVECTNCGHLDTRMVKSCAVCGQATKEHDDATDALIAHALRRGVELRYVDQDADFERAGNIGALLRFRADQNTSQKLAVRSLLR